LDSLTKNDIVDACKESLAIYNRENMEKSLTENGAGIIYEFEEELDLEEEEGGDEKAVQIRRKSIKLEEEAAGMEIIEEEKTETESVRKLI